MRGQARGARWFGVAVLALALLPGTRPVSADTPIDSALLATREAAWRAWFAGDTKTLVELLPPEFTGIAWNDTPFADLAETLAASRAFKDSGGRLVSLTFPETRAQQLGDVVVLYGRFVAVLATGGSEQTVRGRLTEFFVKRGGRWLHPGWHLDATSSPAPVQP